MILIQESVGKLNYNKNHGKTVEKQLKNDEEKKRNIGILVAEIYRMSYVWLLI